MKKLKIILQSNFFLIIILSLISFYILIDTVIIKHQSKFSFDTKRVEGIIKSYTIKDDKITMILKTDKEKIVATYYFKENFDISKIEYGRKVILYGNLTVPNHNTIYNTFDYNKYLYNKQIYYVFKIDKIEFKEDPNILYQLKNWLYKRCQKIDDKGYLQTFVLSIKDIENDTYNVFLGCGIVHLFAVSGMHFGILSKILSWILKKFKLKENISFIIISLFLLLYSFLTGFTASVLRSFILFNFQSLNKYFKLNISNVKLLIYSALIILTFNPFYIYDLGFLYTYSITFGIFIFSKEINNLNKVKSLIFITLISYAFSLPITINSTYEINLLSIIVSLFYSPFICVIFYPLCLITLLIPSFKSLLHLCIIFLEKSILLFNQISFFKIVIPKLSLIIILIYLVILTIYIIKKSFKYFIFLLMLLFIYKESYYLDSSFRSYILDVSQGDCALIVYPNQRKTIMIDTGGSLLTKYKYQDNIIKFMKSINISKLDYLITSHGDYDHMGESINLINNFKVENVIFNCGEYNDLEKELISVLDKKKIKNFSCVKELNIDKYKLEFLNTGEYDNENDNSNVLYMNYDNYKFLFMGDAGIKKEKDILEKYNLKDIEFLKIGHHGSNTSSSEVFIDKMNPKYSLVSVGKNNRYGHPKMEVLDTLKNSKIYRTDLDGSIEIKLKKNGYKIRTCPP